MTLERPDQFLERLQKIRAAVGMSELEHMDELYRYGYHWHLQPSVHEAGRGGPLSQSDPTYSVFFDKHKRAGRQSLERAAGQLTVALEALNAARSALEAAVTRAEFLQPGVDPKTGQVLRRYRGREHFVKALEAKKNRARNGVGYGEG